MSIDTVGPQGAEPDTLREPGSKDRPADASAAGAVPRLVAALRRVDVARLVRLVAVIPAVGMGYPKRDARWPDLYADSTALMQDIGHHPFSESFQYDCGLLDETLSLPATPTSDEAGPRGRLDDFLPSYNSDSVRMHGWVVSPGEPVRCVLVVDADDRVVGMAVYGTPRADVANTVGSPNDELGFVATARGSERSYQAVAVLADGQLVLLDHSLSP